MGMSPAGFFVFAKLAFAGFIARKGKRAGSARDRCASGEVKCQKENARFS